jgi:hypothetical protein
MIDINRFDDYYYKFGCKDLSEELPLLNLN